MLNPFGEQRDEDRTVVLALPHQQAWKPSMYIRAEYMRQQTAPNSRMVVLPNNSVGNNRYYDFSPEDTQKLHAGNMTPFYLQQLRILDELDVKGTVDLTGYSLGGLTVLGIAKGAIMEGRLDVRIVNADEAPNKQRTPKQLQSDFMKSGGWSDQRRAIKDAEIPALEQALNQRRLALDYARFGAATMLPSNKALHRAMAEAAGLDDLLDTMRNNPGTTVKVGRVSGSRVADEAAHRTYSEQYSHIPHINFAEYSGTAAHGHATADSPVAHALMFKHAMALANNKSN